MGFSVNNNPNQPIQNQPTTNNSSSHQGHLQGRKAARKKNKESSSSTPGLNISDPSSSTENQKKRKYDVSDASSSTTKKIKETVLDSDLMVDDDDINISASSSGAAALEEAQRLSEQQINGFIGQVNEAAYLLCSADWDQPEICDQAKEKIIALNQQRREFSKNCSEDQQKEILAAFKQLFIQFAKNPYIDWYEGCIEDFGFPQEILYQIVEEAGKNSDKIMSHIDEFGLSDQHKLELESQLEKTPVEQFKKALIDTSKANINRHEYIEQFVLSMLGEDGSNSIQTEDISRLVSLGGLELKNPTDTSKIKVAIAASSLLRIISKSKEPIHIQEKDFISFIKQIDTIRYFIAEELSGFQDKQLPQYVEVGLFALVLQEKKIILEKRSSKSPFEVETIEDPNYIARLMTEHNKDLKLVQNEPLTPLGQFNNCQSIEYHKELLHAAIRAKHDKVAKFLIERHKELKQDLPVEFNFSLMFGGRSYETILHAAAEAGNEETAQLILNEVQVQLPLPRNETPLINMLNTEGDTALQVAIKKGHAKVAELLIRTLAQHNLEFNPADERGVSILDLCVRKKLSGPLGLIIDLLIDNGVDPLKEFRGGAPLLFLAIKGRSPRSVEKIISFIRQKGEEIATLDEAVFMLCKPILGWKDESLTCCFFKNYPNLIEIIKQVGVENLKDELISKPERITKNLDEAIEICLFLQDPAISTAVRKTTSFDTFNAALDRVKTKNPNLDIDYTSFFAINYEKLNTSMQDDIPEAPKDTSVDELLKLFDTINFTDPNEPGYINPSTLKDDGEPVNKDQLKGYLSQFVSRIQNKEPFLGTPSKEDKKTLSQYYENLETIVRHVIASLKTDPDKESVARALIDLAVAGNHCGGRYIGEAMAIYQLRCTSVNNEEILPRIISKIVQRLQQGAVEQVMGNWREVHAYNRIISTIGKDRSIRGSDQVIDSLSNPVDEETRKEWLDKYDSIFTAKALVELTADVLNTEYAGTDAKTGMKWQDFITDWFKDHMPSDWNKEKFDPILVKTEELIKSNASRKEIASFLMNEGAYLPPVPDPFKAIEEARKQNAVQAGIEAWKDVCSSEEYNSIKRGYDQIIQRKESSIHDAVSEISGFDLWSSYLSSEDQEKLKESLHAIESNQKLSADEKREQANLLIEKYVPNQQQQVELKQISEKIQEQISQGKNLSDALVVVPQNVRDTLLRNIQGKQSRIDDEAIWYLQKNVPVSWMAEDISKIRSEISQFYNPATATVDDVDRLVQFLRSRFGASIAFSVMQPQTAIENLRKEDYLEQEVRSELDEETYMPKDGLWLRKEAAVRMLESLGIIA